MLIQILNLHTYDIEKKKSKKKKALNECEKRGFPIPMNVLNAFEWGEKKRKKMFSFFTIETESWYTQIHFIYTFCGCQLPQITFDEQT